MTSIRLRAGGSPVRIQIERTELPADVWDELTLLLADDSPLPGQPLLVRPERLLHRRGALKGTLLRNRIRLDADDAVVRLLQRTQADDSAVTAALERRTDTNSSNAAAIGLELKRLTRQLRPFQERDLAALLSLNHGANFSVPGAGKTTVTYAVHLASLASRRVERLLVVAPISAFDAWEEEAAAFIEPPMSITRWRGGGIPNTDVVLLNYQRLPSAVERITAWMSYQPVHLVVDEAHRAKRGAAGGWGRALLEFAPLAARRDILTGTPAPNHPRDLGSLLNILWPGGRVASLIPAQALQSDPPLNAMAAVAAVIKPLYVRTTKEELDLPAPTIRVVRVRLGPLQRDIYDAMLNRYAGMFDLDRRDSAMFAQMGEVTMHLLQAACSPRLLSTDDDPTRSYRYPPLSIPPRSRLASLVESYGEHEFPAKMAQACAIVHENARQGRKTLIWSNFPANLLTLETHLAGLYPALIYGATPSDDDAGAGIRTRQRELSRFRQDSRCMVLLANPAAMSEGVSLHQTCHDAIYLDRTFNAGQYLQSLDRIHRLGLDHDAITTVTLLVAEGTIDERVDRRVEIKTLRLSRMLSDPGLVQMALPDDDDYGDALDDPDDLEEILRHLGDARASDTAHDNPSHH